MPKPTPSTRPAERSTPTDGWLECPDASLFHPQIPTASRVMRGPKALWTECTVCGARRLVAPRLLRVQPNGTVVAALPDGSVRPVTTVGLTLAQVHAKGLTPV